MFKKKPSPLFSLIAFVALACGGGTTEPQNGNGDGDGDSSSTDTGGAATGGAATGGAADTPGTGGAASGGDAATGGDAAGGTWNNHDLSACDDANLEWKNARKTHYTSHPDPGSEECIVYNGCMWAGWFAGCSGQRTDEWVASHNIAAVFPNFESLNGHLLCLRSGETKMIVNVIDTCGDSDCDGCCTQNQGANDALVDLESHTNARWGLIDSIIEWADLGPNPEPICP